MKRRKDKLSEAIARLRREGHSADVPKEIVDETLKRIADCGFGIADGNDAPLQIRNPQFAIRNLFRLAAAAAILIICGYATGRLSAPKPPDLDALREALAPSVAAVLEPALRQKVMEDIRGEFQLAWAGTYVRIKEELTEQYRDDISRAALQILAASNATTNERLTQLAQSIDTAQTQDLRHIAQAQHEIETSREQDKTQFASGLQTLAYRTEDELSRTQRAIAQLLGEARPTDSQIPPVERRQTP
jgi:HPt (histidine-containing phosphotransfer) domain-containing protein